MGGSTTPAVPWTGSTRMAQVRGPAAAFAAARSPKGTIRNPGVGGPKPSATSRQSLQPAIARVHPWSWPLKTMTSASPAGTPLRW